MRVQFNGREADFFFFLGLLIHVISFQRSFDSSIITRILHKIAITHLKMEGFKQCTNCIYPVILAYKKKRRYFCMREM